MTNLLVTSSPHIRQKPSREMANVMFALIPAFIIGVYFFGIPALILCLSSIISCVLFDILMFKIKKVKVSGMSVGGSVLTGLLLAFCVSPVMPWWTMTIGAFIAIVLVKHAFGGVGFNIFNPALVARAFLLASWPALMTTWHKPLDAITSPTPLALLKEHHVLTDYMTMFIGNHAGSIGETSAMALIVGALYLLYRRTIEYRIPAGYMLTVALFAFIFNQDILFNLLAGGLILGAFFMATDPVTSPVSKPGRWAFGIGCGIITMVIRLWGGYPEGVCYAILIMNTTTPLLDRYLPGRIFGRKRWSII